MKSGLLLSVLRMVCHLLPLVQSFRTQKACGHTDNIFSRSLQIRHGTDSFSLDDRVLHPNNGITGKSLGLPLALVSSLLCNVILSSRHSSHIVQGIGAKFDIKRRARQVATSIGRSKLLDTFKLQYVPRYSQHKLCLSRQYPQLNCVDLTDWKVAALTEKKILNEDYHMYKFSFPFQCNSLVRFSVGEEVCLCAMDSNGRPNKGNYFPVTPTSKGVVEIVSPSHNIVSADKFALSLNYLEIGDEVGIKAGENKLPNVGNHSQPITHVTLIASRLGIIPTYHLVKEILSDSSTTVQGVNLLWINEQPSDFIFNQELDDLQLDYYKSFELKRVVDSNAHVPKTRIARDLRESFRNFRTGDVAILFAPQTLSSKSQDFLVNELGYPAEQVFKVASVY